MIQTNTANLKHVSSPAATAAPHYEPPPNASYIRLKKKSESENSSVKRSFFASSSALNIYALCFSLRILDMTLFPEAIPPVTPSKIIIVLPLKRVE